MSLSGVELSGTSFFFFFALSLALSVALCCLAGPLEGNTKKKKKFPLLTKKKTTFRPLWVKDTRSVFHPSPRRPAAGSL